MLSPMMNVRAIHVVDPNPAQLALCRVKLALLQEFNPTSRLEILGHRELAPDERERCLSCICDQTGDAVSIFGALEYINEVGLDYAGRYEAVFREITNSIAASSADVLELLQLGSPTAQVRWLYSHPDFDASLRDSFDQVLRIDNLVALFGATATQNPIMDFSSHFFQRTMYALQYFNARSNHFLWQVLATSAPSKPVAQWLSQPMQQISVDLSYAPEMVQTYLEKVDVKFDYIHLSNVIDWLSVEEAQSLLELAWSRLKPKGYTLVRQLNSNLPIRLLGDCFSWLNEESDELHREDLSYFYRGVHCGQKF